MVGRERERESLSSVRKEMITASGNTLLRDAGRARNANSSARPVYSMRARTLLPLVFRSLFGIFGGPGPLRSYWYWIETFWIKMPMIIWRQSFLLFSDDYCFCAVVRCRVSGKLFLNSSTKRSHRNFLYSMAVHSVRYIDNFGMCTQRAVWARTKGSLRKLIIIQGILQSLCTEAGNFLFQAIHSIASKGFSSIGSAIYMYVTSALKRRWFKLLRNFWNFEMNERKFQIITRGLANNSMRFTV